MKTYRIMVVAYGYADIEANSEEEALAMVDDMDDGDFGWDYGYSSEDAKVVDEWEEDSYEDEDENEE